MDGRVEMGVCVAVGEEVVTVGVLVIKGESLGEGDAEDVVETVGAGWTTLFKLRLTPCRVTETGVAVEVSLAAINCSLPSRPGFWVSRRHHRTQSY